MLASRAVTERQRQSVDEDGLAGAGLPGQCRKTRPKFELQPVDYHEIPIDRCRTSAVTALRSVQLLAQHGVVAVTRRMNNDRVLGAPDDDAVAFLKITLQLAVKP